MAFKLEDRRKQVDWSRYQEAASPRAEFPLHLSGRGERLHENAL